MEMNELNTDPVFYASMMTVVIAIVVFIGFAVAKKFKS